VLLLVAVGILMTTVMQSSTAAIAVTLSAQYAGAVGLVPRIISARNAVFPCQADSRSTDSGY
jgi:hypothetical protein